MPEISTTRLSLERSFLFFRLPEDLIGQILCDWLADVRCLTCLDIAACNYDKEAILHRGLEKCIISNLVVPENPSLAEKCFCWFRRRKVSIIALKSCDINIFAQHFQILLTKPPVSILSKLESIELIGRCQPFQQDNALQKLRLLQSEAPNLSNIRSSLSPYHSLSKTTNNSLFSTNSSSFSPSRSAEDDLSFYSTFLSLLLRGRGGDNKGYLSSLDMSLSLKEDRRIFQTYFPLHSPFLKSLVLRDVFLYDRDIVALLQQLPYLEIFHLFRQDNMPYGGSLPPKDTWAVSRECFISQETNSADFNLSLFNLKELVLGAPASSLTSSSSMNIPIFTASSALPQTTNLLSAFLLFCAPSLRKIVIRDHFVTDAMYETLVTQTVRNSVTHLTLQGCVSIFISEKDRAESAMGVEDYMSLVFPALLYMDLKDGCAETLMSIVTHLCTVSLFSSMSTSEDISLETNNIIFDHKASQLRNLTLSVSPTLRTLQLVPLFPTFSPQENIFSMTMKATLVTLHLSYIGLDAHSWCIIFFEMPQLSSLQWDGYSAIEFDAALSALEEYHRDYSDGDNNNYLDDDNTHYLNINDIIIDSSSINYPVNCGLKTLTLEARPGTPIDLDDSRRFLTLLSDVIPNHSHSLRQLSLHRFVFADVDLYDCLLQKFPLLETLDISLSCDELTLEYPEDLKRATMSKLRVVHFTCGNRVTAHGLCIFIKSLLSHALIKVTCWQCSQLTDMLCSLDETEHELYMNENFAEENKHLLNRDEWKLLKIGQQLLVLGGKLVIDDRLVPRYRCFVCL